MNKNSTLCILVCKLANATAHTSYFWEYIGLGAGKLNTGSKYFCASLPSSRRRSFRNATLVATTSHSLAVARKSCSLRRYQWQRCRNAHLWNKRESLRNSEGYSRIHLASTLMTRSRVGIRTCSWKACTNSGESIVWGVCS